jgi:hypothetical protein
MAKHVLVHKTSGSLGSQAANPSVITDGDIALYNGNTSAVLAASYSGGLVPFFYAQGVPSGRNVRLSPIIKSGAVKSITKKVYAATVQPILIAGYQGSGALTLNFLAASGSTNVPYGMKIENLVNNVPPFPKAYSQFTLTASKGAANQNPVYVADQLAKDLNNQLTVMPTIDGGQFALVDVLSDLTLATAPQSAGTTPTYAVTNGSNVLTITAGATDLALNAGTAAGCWIRIGGSAATYPVYQILSVATTSSTATITLTRPFVGTTATGVAIANLKVGASASVLPTSSSLAGIKVTVTGNYFTGNNYAASKPNTNVNIPLSDTLAGTPVSVSQALVYGSGSANYVLNQEMQALGNLGVENRIWLPLPNDTYAVTGVNYDCYSLYYENAVADKSAQGQGRIEPGILDIYVVNGTTVTNFESSLVSLTGVQSATWS